MKPNIPYRPVLDLPLMLDEDRYKIFDKLNHPDFFFVEIGAYDGITCDPNYNMIEKYNWRGILLEPQPEGVFERLQSNFKNQNLTFLNAALHDSDSTANIFHHGSETSFVKREDLSKDWNMRLQSFKEAPEMEVKTISWKSLKEHYGITKLDFLHVDTEGMDYEIINTVLQSGVVPTIIQFESNVFFSIEQSKEMFKTLREFGYVLFHNKYPYAMYDCLAIQESFYE